MRIKMILLLVLLCLAYSCQEEAPNDSAKVITFYDQYRNSGTLNFFKGITVHPVRGFMGIIFSEDPNKTYLLYKSESQNKYSIWGEYPVEETNKLYTLISRFDTLNIFGIVGHNDTSYIQFKITYNLVLVYIPESDKLSDMGKLYLKENKAIKFDDKWFYYTLEEN